MHKALVHRKGDHVAVAVAPIAAGEEFVVVYLDEDGEQRLLARADVPYGHKIALAELPEGAPVTEYAVQVGVTARGSRRATTCTPTT